MIEKTRIILTNLLDPWANLAFEEYMLLNNAKNTCVLFLWQNDRTVVIGRHQNPWQECNLPLMEKENIKLARRISGGGAVYHDIGNLNFSFVLNRSDYDVQRQCDVIIKALNKLGLKAQRTGRNDMTIEDRKFSGNAFCYKGNNAFHHGTILIKADKEKMARYLNVSMDKMVSKGVTSVKSRVVNLVECDPNITVDIVKEKVAEAFCEEYGYPDKIELAGASQLTGNKAFQSLVERNASWDWLYGNTPDFNISFQNRFSWGGLEILLKVEDAVIKEVNIFSDALCEELISVLQEVFKGVKYSKEEIMRSIDPQTEAFHVLKKDMDVKNQVLQDIRNWISDNMN